MRGCVVSGRFNLNFLSKVGKFGYSGNEPCCSQVPILLRQTAHLSRTYLFASFTSSQPAFGRRYA